MLPNFLIIGAQRSGTTTLHRVLGIHPDIFTTPEKELYFFTDPRYSRGLRWYESHFRQWQGEKAVGESSPDYMLSEVAAERISQTLPGARLILIIRNPVERMYSAYWNNRLNLTERYGSFEEAIASDPLHVERGFYLKHIQKYLRYFPREQLLVLIHDDLRGSPASVYRRCFEFLGVDPSVDYPEMAQAYNQVRARGGPLYRLAFKHPGILRYLPKGTGARRLFKLGRPIQFQYPPMDIETRKRLISIYEEPNQRLGEFLGRDLSHWNTLENSTFRAHTGQAGSTRRNAASRHPGSYEA